MFAHTHGFYSLGKFVPREIYFCTIEADPQFVDGFVVSMEGPVTQKDWKANRYVVQNHHGMHFKNLINEVRPGDQLQRRMKQIIGDRAVYVKGPSQMTFFKEFTPNVTDMDKRLPKFENLVWVDVPVGIIDMFHVKTYHRKHLQGTCSQIKAYNYARYLHDIL